MRPNRDKYCSLTDLKKKLAEGKDFRVLFKDRQSDASIVSPHGGFIEAGTSHLARAIAGDTFNLYDFQGLVTKKPWRLHVTSTRFRDEPLTDILNQSRVAVSIHGMGRTASGTIWMGGLNKALKQQIERCLSDAGIKFNPNPRLYKGSSKKNFVNLPESNGVQLELAGDLLNDMFVSGLTFANAEGEGEPELNELGKRFVEAVRRGLFLYLPGRLLT